MGRFQVDGLTVGHCELLDHVYSKHDRMLVLIGVRPAEQSDTNPLAFADRHAMIQGAYPDAVVVPISDTSSDHVWSNNSGALIQSVCVYGGEAVFNVGGGSFSGYYHSR